MGDRFRCTASPLNTHLGARQGTACRAAPPARAERDRCAAWAMPSPPSATFGMLAAAMLAMLPADRSAAAVNALCSGTPTAECIDLTVDGVRFETRTSGVRTIRIGDGVDGVVDVVAGTSGIALTWNGTPGFSAEAEATYESILWDTDGDPDTDEVSVVSEDGVEPFLVEGEYIFHDGGDPPTYTLAGEAYTGLELAQFLAATTDDPGGALAGSLTLNNNVDVDGPVFDRGSLLTTTEATAVLAEARAGRGGNGGCFTILLFTWCDDGGTGGTAGSVVVNSNGEVVVASTGADHRGISAISQGGNGGNGGGSFGLLASFAGRGGNGGAGSDVFVSLGPDSVIETEGLRAHGVFARSRGGNGGSGGEPSSFVALGENGGTGGDAGDVLVDNDGAITTRGENSHGVYAHSVGAGAGSGSSAGGAIAIGGNGGNESDGGRVTVNNSGTVLTGGGDSYGLFAQSVGGGGGDGGDAGGLFTVGGRAGSGGNADIVTVVDSGTVTTTGDRATAIFAQSIGGGGGNGGDAVSFSSTIGVAVGGAGGLGGDGDLVEVTAAGSDIDTEGAGSSGIHAQSVGGGGGNGGLAVAGALPSGSSVNASIALGGDGGGGGDAGVRVEVSTTAATTIDTLGSGANGILAQSIGGGGGNGGSAFSGTGGGGLSVSVAVGGRGGVAGNGGAVTVDNAATVTTDAARSAGILAQSVGGGGGSGGFAAALSVGAGAASIGLGGSGGSGGTSGLVDVTHTGTIETRGDSAGGIIAQSVGGGGGTGGSSVAASGGVLALSTALGGAGGSGNNAGEVTVRVRGDVDTEGSLAHGVLGQSVGGGGGDGGFALSGAFAVSVEGVPAGAAAVSVGGAGGGASHGGPVTIELDSGDVGTAGAGAHAVVAQSIGGGGGNGGFAGAISLAVGTGGSIGVAVGGGGANGGDAGTVTIDSAGFGSIVTAGDGADGLRAQSVGGGGGDGGFAFSGAAGFGGEKNLNATVAIGGGGGSGGEGNVVVADNTRTIVTRGDRARGIFAQSLGGGGGTGGLAVTGTLGISPTAGNVGVTVGGAGGSGNVARAVTLTNAGRIETDGTDSVGIFGQSIGGGGGDGGLALGAQLTGATEKSATIGVSVGGGGGSGNAAGEVSIDNLMDGAVVTRGFGAHGIKGQSIGGGGGNAGAALVAQLGVGLGSEEQDTKTLNVGVAVGGGGGDGGAGRDVTVTNDGAIDTSGDTATGIFAQSIGGGGGDGGGALNAIGLLTDSTNDDSRAVNADVTIGGSGGNGNRGGSVDVVNAGDIVTRGVSGAGIHAQSIGGGGGIGGRANTFSLVVTDACTVPILCTAPPATKNNFQLGVSVGGAGGGASDGGAVTVTNTGRIETVENLADGIHAQSIGGGGGAGGNGILGSGELLPVPVELVFAPVSAVPFYKNLRVAVGGSAGSSGDGGNVTVDSAGDVIARGSNSNGIFAQSVGGGGGTGGRAAIGALGTLGLGGEGGAGGDGGEVSVRVRTGTTVDTYAVASNGIFAQSVGGGGGVAGNVDRALAADVETPVPGLTIPGLNLGVGLAFGRSGGAGGDGRPVSVAVEGAVVTRGDNAAGVFAQSVGGGGGVLGELGNDLPVLDLLSWQIGSAGDAGSAGAVTVDVTGTVATAGNHATGVFAQSAGGTGTAGAVEVTVAGSVLTGAQAGDAAADRGLGSVGILAQSVAADAADGGAIRIAVAAPDAVVRGGASRVLDADRAYIGVGIWVMDGTDNEIVNRGTVTTLGGVDEGFAILATGSDDDHPGGSETVINEGTVIGSVMLGAGVNAFENRPGARFETGAVLSLGAGNSVVNAGAVAPGGAGRVRATAVTGDYMQTPGGLLQTDLDLASGEADRLEVSGTAALSGGVEVGHVNAGRARPGRGSTTIVSAQAGLTAAPALTAPTSAVMDYRLERVGTDELRLDYGIDFNAPTARGRFDRNRAVVGAYVNALQSAGGSEAFAPIAVALVSISDDDTLGRAYDRLTPELVNGAGNETAGASLAFNDAMHSCRTREGAYRFVRQDECRWVRVQAGFRAQDDTARAAGYDINTFTLGGGVQREVAKDLHLGYGLSASTFDLGSDVARTDGYQVEIGAIAKRRIDATMLSGSLAAGFGWFDSRRFVSLPTPDVTAASDQRTGYLSAHLRASHDVMSAPNSYLRPLLDLGIMRLRRSAFDETGAGAANLSVEKAHDTLVTVHPALELGGEARLAQGWLARPYLRVGATRYLTDNTRELTATLEGAPAGLAPLVVETEGDRTFADVSVGLDLLDTDRLQLEFAYRGQFSDHTRFHGGHLKVRVTF